MESGEVVLMPRANGARGKVRGALPRIPAGGTPPETPGPLSLVSQLSERSSPSRVRCAAQTTRALDCSGPFRTLDLDQGKRATGNAPQFAAPSGLPLVGTRLHEQFGVDKTS